MQKATKNYIVWINMSEGKSILDIRVKLKGEVRNRFLRIKSAKGLTNNTEVLRLIINEYFEKNLAKRD
ncbi:MAG: hypothetical protein QXQ61_00270 [Candidatus Bathyarchaeia archaeon]